MFEIRLPQDGVSRIEAYLARLQGPQAATMHWRHFGSMNQVKCDSSRNCLVVEAGAGFDSRFELNFRRLNLFGQMASFIRRVGGRDPIPWFRRAYHECGGNDADLTAAEVVLGPPMTEHKILAAHYLQRLRYHIGEVRSYLEIGAGSGYLAALVRAHNGCRLTIVDLPEMLPFSLIFLLFRFPEASFRLPGEHESDSDMVFLTPDLLHGIPGGSIDLAVNTASFGEMLPEQVNSYFGFLRRVAAEGLFLNVNREQKAMIRIDGTGDQIAVRFDDYPWSPNDIDLIHGPSEFHARVQPQNPMRFRLCKLAAN